jgi:Mpv17 / PMP22 family
MRSSIVKIILSVLMIFHFTSLAHSTTADGFTSGAAGLSAAMLAANRRFLMYDLTSTTRSPHSLSPTITTIRGGGGGQLQAAGLVDGLWKQHPFLAAAIVCAIKAAAADLVVQRRQQQQSNKVGHDKTTTTMTTTKATTKIDAKRTLAFVLYGALYQGVVQEYIYNTLYSRMFGDHPTLAVIATKVGFDAIFHNALICVPMAYIVKAIVFRYSPLEGLRRYRDDVLHHGLLIRYYCIWIPVNFCVYAFIPKHFRITTMAVVSFFWMTILSTISSRPR